MATLVSIASIITAITFWPWYMHTNQIVSYLFSKTQHGSSEDDIIEYLKKNDMHFNETWRGQIKANTNYPPNSTGGRSFIHANIAEYGVFLSTSVEAFYIFDNNRKLIEITVRKTTDAL